MNWFTSRFDTITWERKEDSVQVTLPAWWESDPVDHGTSRLRPRAIRQGAHARQCLRGRPRWAAGVVLECSREDVAALLELRTAYFEPMRNTIPAEYRRLFCTSFTFANELGSCVMKYSN